MRAWQNDVLPGAGGTLPGLDGRVFLVTEAGSLCEEGGGAAGPNVTGLGEAFAILAARSGASLVLVDRCPLRLAATRDRIEAQGGRAITIPADLSDPAKAAGAVAACRAAFGRLDGLVSHVRCPCGGADDDPDENRGEGRAAISGGPGRARGARTASPAGLRAAGLRAAGIPGAVAGPLPGLFPGTVLASRWDGRSAERSCTLGLRAEQALYLSRLAAATMARQGGGTLVSVSCTDGFPDRARSELTRLNELVAREFRARGVRANAVTASCPGPDDLHPGPSGTWLRSRQAGTWHAARAMMHLAGDETLHVSGTVLTPDDLVPLPG